LFPSTRLQPIAIRTSLLATTLPYTLIYPRHPLVKLSFFLPFCVCLPLSHFLSLYASVSLSLPSFHYLSNSIFPSIQYDVSFSINKLLAKLFLYSSSLHYYFLYPFYISLTFTVV